MKLTQQQIEHFNREGWLFLPELFTKEETNFLAREAVNIYDANRPEVWREKSGAPRTAWLDEAQLLRLERYAGKIQGRADYFQRFRDIELGLGPSRKGVLLAPFLFTSAGPEFR